MGLPRASERPAHVTDEFPKEKVQPRVQNPGRHHLYPATKVPPAERGPVTIVRFIGDVASRGVVRANSHKGAPRKDHLRGLYWPIIFKMSRSRVSWKDEGSSQLETGRPHAPPSGTLVL